MTTTLSTGNNNMMSMQMQTANADFNPDEINTGIADCNQEDPGTNTADCFNFSKHTVTAPTQTPDDPTNLYDILLITNVVVDCDEFGDGNNDALCLNNIDTVDNVFVGPVTQTNNDPAAGSNCLLYTSPSPRDRQKSRMPSSA